MAHLERIDVGSIGSAWVDRRQPRKPKGVFERILPPLENVPLTKTRTTLGEPAGPEEQKRIDEMKLPAGTYPGGAQIEGWSPLRDRTPWKVPEVTRTQQRLGLLPDWYLAIRSEVAVWLEIMRRIQPHVKFLGVRFPLPIYSLPALLILIASAPLIPGPAIYNILLAPILLFGGDIKWLDRAVALTQPLLYPIVNTLSAVKWAVESVANIVGNIVIRIATLGQYGTGRLLAKGPYYYPMFNRKKKEEKAN